MKLQYLPSTACLTFLFLLTRAAMGDTLPVPPAPKPLGRSLKLLFIGDSNTENGFVTGGIAKAMEQVDGYYGSGYHSLQAEIGMGRPGAYLPYLKITNVGAWTKHLMCPNADNRAFFSPDGTSISSTDPAAHCDVDFYGTAVDIFWLADPAGGQFSAATDGRESEPVDTKAGAREVRRTRIDGLSAGWHHLALSVKSGDVTLLGADAYAANPDQNIAIVNKWGRGYAETRHFAAIPADIEESGLKLLAPDVVCIMFGTNDIALGGTSKAAYFDNLTKLIERVRAAVPTAHILLLSTLPTGTAGTMLEWNVYRDGFPVYAKALAVDYFDLGGWCGGTPQAIMDKGYVFKQESLHFNDVGGDAVGAKIFEAANALVAGPPAAQPAEALQHLEDRSPNRPQLSKFIKLWIAADGPLQVDSNQGIAMLGNMRGSFYARQPAPAWRPTLSPDAANGKPAIHFDGKSSYLALSEPSSMKGFTMVWRARVPGGGLFDEGRFIYEFFGPGPAGTSKLIDQKVAKLKGSFFVNGKPVDVENVEYPVNQWQILTYVGDRFNNVRGIGENEYIVPYSNPPVRTFSVLDGDIAELIFLNPALDDKTRMESESYFATKYGIKLDSAAP